jgi:hypothetical protein
MMRRKYAGTTGPTPVPHLRWDWGSTLPHLRRDRAHPMPTSAPGPCMRGTITRMSACVWAPGGQCMHARTHARRTHGPTPGSPLCANTRRARKRMHGRMHARTYTLHARAARTHAHMHYTHARTRAQSLARAHLRSLPTRRSVLSASMLAAQSVQDEAQKAKEAEAPPALPSFQLHVLPRAHTLTRAHVNTHAYLRTQTCVRVRVPRS